MHIFIQQFYVHRYRKYSRKAYYHSSFVAKMWNLAMKKVLNDINNFLFSDLIQQWSTTTTNTQVHQQQAATTSIQVHQQDTQATVLNRILMLMHKQAEILKKHTEMLDNQSTILKQIFVSGQMSKVKSLINWNFYLL